MLVAFVAKGINLYLGRVATGQGKGVAEMILHHLSHIASNMFKQYQLDGRWYGKHHEISEPEPKKARTEPDIAIKFRWQPKFMRELVGNRPTIVSQVTGYYQPQAIRGHRALIEVPLWPGYQ